MPEPTPNDLKAVCLKRSPRGLAKAGLSIDLHAHRLAAMPPFCEIATTGLDGSACASPHGGNAGFVHVEAPNLLLLPEPRAALRIDVKETHLRYGKALMWANLWADEHVKRSRSLNIGEINRGQTSLRKKGEPGHGRSPALKADVSELVLRPAMDGHSCT